MTLEFRGKVGQIANRLVLPSFVIDTVRQNYLLFVSHYYRIHANQSSFSAATIHAYLRGGERRCLVDTTIKNVSSWANLLTLRPPTLVLKHFLLSYTKISVTAATLYAFMKRPRHKFCNMLPAFRNSTPLVETWSITRTPTTRRSRQMSYLLLICTSMRPQAPKEQNGVGQLHGHLPTPFRDTGEKEHLPPKPYRSFPALFVCSWTAT